METILNKESRAAIELMIADGIIAKDAAERYFPELKESEDERIRKAILELVRQSSEILEKKNQEQMIAWLEKQCENISLPKFTFDDVLALQCAMEAAKKVQKDKDLYEQLESLHNRLHDAYWLKKQCEQNLANSAKTCKVEPKFKIEKEKWYVCTQTYVLRGKIVVIKGQTYQAEKDNVIKGEDGCLFIDRHDGKASDYFRYWTIQDAQDAKAGDVLATKAGGIFIYKELLYDKPFAYCGVDKFGVFKDCNCGDGLDWTPYLSDVTPATKEQRDTLMKAMADAGYTFDFEKKELKKIEQNPAWSEEDEAMWAEISDLLWEGYKQSGSKFSWDDIRNWVNPKLKSLKDRYSWKPSDEQMDAVKSAALDVAKFSSRSEQSRLENEPYYKALVSLCNDLEKLREE